MSVRAFTWACLLGAAAAFAPLPLTAQVTAPEALKLMPSVTVNAEVVRLKDLFRGELSQPEKVVAQAPAPGQRYVLQADWLAGVARNLGLAWRPTGPLDRTMVYRPGQTISPGEIIAALKTELQAKGMPQSLGVKTSSPLAPLTIAATSARDIAIREAYFDADAKTFSAIAEIPAGDPAAHYVQLRGTAIAYVQVPVFIRSGARNTPITPDMLTTIEMAENDLDPSIVRTAEALIGLSPRVPLRPGQTIRNTDVIEVTFMDIPTLRRDTRRGEEITASDIVWTSVNADEITSEVLTDDAQIIGKSPRRMQVAGSPIRRGDLQISRKAEIAVAARDMRRGALVSADDVQWITVSEGDISGKVIEDIADFEGKMTTHAIRAGQTLRPVDFASQKVVAKGKAVTVLYATSVMQLTAKGVALEDGGVGDIIRIANSKSKTPVLAVVLNADQVRVTAEQTAMTQ
jgi:flagella basal body P-ring formation protein FlgA